MTRQSEQTEVGEQTLIDGVRPVTLGEKLTARTFHPMTPKRNPNAQQRPCDIGLFDVIGRAQIDLLDFINLQTPPTAK
ncbi:MAG: hypothetical protein L3J65_11945 [Robiginitomaculum sp.]|nr:hypothetical protein [Robiginitomaculum sp.]